MVHARPEARTGNSTVACECVGAAGCGSESTDAGEEENAENEEEETETARGRAGYGFEYVTNGLAISLPEDLCNIRKNKSVLIRKM